MVIPALLGAGVGLAGAIMQSQAQKDQRDLSYLNLYEQKRQARERETLAKATRSDAYGNKVKYVPGQGFVTDVTPLTRAILGSQQKEQLAQFRDDAPRNRDAAIRIDKRSKQAGEVFDEKFNKYRYRREKTEEEYVAEAIRNAIDSQRESGDNGGNELLARSILRAGNSGMARNLYAASKESKTTPSLSQLIADAKKQGKQQFLAERGAENQVAFSELEGIRSIADAIMQGNMNWDNENNALSGRQDGALSGLIQTNAANSSAISGAYGAAGQAAGQSPDLGNIASALSSMKIPQSQPKQTEQEKLLADLLLQQRIGSARVGINQNNASLYKGNTGMF